MARFMNYASAVTALGLCLIIELRVQAEGRETRRDIKGRAGPQNRGIVE